MVIAFASHLPLWRGTGGGYPFGESPRVGVAEYVCNESSQLGMC